MARPRKEDTPERRAARERQARYRQRKDAAQVEQIASGRDDDAADPSSAQLVPAGIIQFPSAAKDSGKPESDSPETVADLMTEQAIWVQRRRVLTELEIKRRKGELIEREEADRQAASLGRRVRAALDRAPSHLPADLIPADRERCAKALSIAIEQAMASL